MNKKTPNGNRIAVKATTNETWGKKTGKENLTGLKGSVDLDGEVIRIGEDNGKESGKQPDIEGNRFGSWHTSDVRSGQK